MVTINLKWSEDKIKESTLQVTISWEKCWQFNVFFNTTLPFSHKKKESKEMKWPAVSSVSLCACTFPGEHSPGTQFESGHGRDALNEEMDSWQMRRCCPISCQPWSGSELAERIH